MAKEFHPVIRLPRDYEVYDFTKGYDPNRALASPFGIGRYNERRPGMYQGELYTDAKEQRDIHIGIDIGAPVGTPVHAFAAGEIFLFAFNGAPWDYGNTLITKHQIDGRPIFALHGHLSGASIAGKTQGQAIGAGEVIAWVGDRQENGGWNPHLHFQLSWVEPTICDMPGVVSASQLSQALRTYPDPQMVLGKLY